jgi:hypothetical protein
LVAAVFHPFRIQKGDLGSGVTSSKRGGHGWVEGPRQPRQGRATIPGGTIAIAAAALAASGKIGKRF